MTFWFPSPPLLLSTAIDARVQFVFFPLPFSPFPTQSAGLLSLSFKAARSVQSLSQRSFATHANGADCLLPNVISCNTISPSLRLSTARLVFASLRLASERNRRKKGERVTGKKRKQEKLGRKGIYFRKKGNHNPTYSKCLPSSRLSGRLLWGWQLSGQRLRPFPSCRSRK